MGEILIEDIRRCELLKSLAYPSNDASYALRTLKDLEELGVESLLLNESGGLELLGKGYRNIVVACRKGGEVLAAKIRRTDFAVKDVVREVEIHRVVNGLGIGPRLHGYGELVILMELIKGSEISRWLAEERSPPALKEVLTQLLYQCYTLDAEGIDHGELSDARRHIFISGNRPVVLDFGSARRTKRPANLTSFLNFLFHGRAAHLKDRMGLVEPDRELLRSYKTNPSEGALERVISVIFSKTP